LSFFLTFFAFIQFINGSKAPNKNGQDVFYFIVSKDRIIPCGTKDETTRGFDNDCKLKSGGELGCTAWVIYNENMDYLHCGAYHGTDLQNVTR
jgi:hypothetical protein